MLETARFIQAGRLTEATTFLQRLLAGELAPEIVSADPAEAPPARHAPPIINVAPETIEMTEHRPAPPTRQAAGSGARGGTAATVQPALPEALRSFLERFNGSGLEAGLGGLAKPFPAPAPELVPDGAKFLAGSYGNQAGSRAYKLYVPSSYHGQALPLVVMLHGCTQSPDDFAAGTRMNLLAEEHTCLVAYPAQTSSANPSKCWNWFKAEDQRRDGGDRPASHARGAAQLS